MRKRAGLARALVLDPEIILFDEPDSGLDPVRTAYLDQLIVDLNAQIDATMLIVTHNIETARTVPDNLGMLYRRELVMFGPARGAADQRGAGRPPVPERPPDGPIGMSEEKDADELAAESRARSCRRCRRSRSQLQHQRRHRRAAHQREPGAWCRDNGVTAAAAGRSADDADATEPVAS